jgi:hypothetical protein
MTKKTQNTDAEKLAQQLDKKSDEMIKTNQFIYYPDKSTVSGYLGQGVLYENKIHRAFTLRMQVVKDTLELTQDESYARTVEAYARTLVSLGDIPKEKITFDFLAENISDQDIDILYAAEKFLLKKRSEVTDA